MTNTDKTVGELFGLKSFHDIEKRIVDNDRGLFYYKDLEWLIKVILERGHTHLRVPTDTKKILDNPITE